MWVRKSTKKIESIRRWRRYGPRDAFYGSMIMLIGCFLMIWTGFHRGARSIGPQPFSIALNQAATIAAVFFPILWFLQILTGLHFEWTKTICDNCHLVSDHKASETCPCGGVREPIEYWNEVK